MPGPRVLLVEPRIIVDGGARSTLRLLQRWTRLADVVPRYATPTPRRLRQVLAPALARLARDASPPRSLRPPLSAAGDARRG